MADDEQVVRRLHAGLTVEDEEEEPTDTEEDLDIEIERMKFECGNNRTWPNETEEETEQQNYWGAQMFLEFWPKAPVVKRERFR